MKFRACLTIVLGSVTSLAWAEVVSVDVGEWASTDEAVTPGDWTVCGIDLYKADRSANFNALGDYAVSPAYQGYVTQLVVGVCSTQPVLLRNLKAIPVMAAGEARTWTMDFTPDEDYVEQSFAWRTTEMVRQFRLQIEGHQHGNWRVRSLTVCLDRVEPPQAVREECVYADALSVGWASEPRAVAHEVEAAQVVTVPREYRLLERWNFSVLTNATGNPLQFEDVPGASSLTGVSGEYLNVQARSGGYLQAGNTKGAGMIRFDLRSEGERTGLVRLYRSDAAGSDGPVRVSTVDACGATNTVAEPFLTTHPHEFSFELSAPAHELLIATDVKSRRIRVEDVEIVTDYVPGNVSTNVVATSRTSGGSTVVKGLSPGDWLWRVRSYDGRGFVSAWSPYRAVTLEGGYSRYCKPGVVVILR